MHLLEEGDKRHMFSWLSGLEPFRILNEACPPSAVAFPCLEDEVQEPRASAREDSAEQPKTAGGNNNVQGRNGKGGTSSQVSL